MIALALILVALASAGPAFATVCVENASEDTWVFVAQSDNGPREVATLDPGGTLCSTGEAPMGTVAVFAAPTDLEGCTRRIPSGVTEHLLAFPNVDLCTWNRRN